MKNAILQKLKTKGDGVSFVDLSEIEGFKGDLWYGDTDKNIYLWFSCSQEAVDAIKSLIDKGRIELKETSPFVYHADGLIPKFPIAKQLRPYKNARWCPVAFYKGHKFEG